MYPDAVRIYPCLTVKGTALEKLYRAGKYTPWSLKRTEEELAMALLRLWNKNIHVIRMGVAHEEGLDQSIIAGPSHPALGQKVRSKALYLYLRSRLGMLGPNPKQLYVPSKYSGELWGHRGNLKPLYRKVGISPENTIFSTKKLFYLKY